MGAAALPIRASGTQPTHHARKRDHLTNVLDPELFVLGGGLAAGADLYLEPIKAWFGELIYQPELRPMPEIAFARWNERAGAVGAALLHTAHEGFSAL